jgi:hypothetical protein
MAIRLNGDVSEKKHDYDFLASQATTPVDANASIAFSRRFYFMRPFRVMSPALCAGHRELIKLYGSCET